MPQILIRMAGQTSQGSLNAICITTPYMPLFRQAIALPLKNKPIEIPNTRLRNRSFFVLRFHDQKRDAQVTEVNSKGQVVWRWYAKDHLDVPPYNDIYDDG